MSKYTQKAAAPLYVPRDVQPTLASLVDNAFTQKLLEEIAKSSVSDEEKAFLRVSAYRHNVFHYGRIADYYAHATPEMQSLMEKSALVIIDLNQAIELGYVRLKQTLEQLRESEEAKRNA